MQTLYYIFAVAMTPSKLQGPCCLQGTFINKTYRKVVGYISIINAPLNRKCGLWSCKIKSIFIIAAQFTFCHFMVNQFLIVYSEGEAHRKWVCCHKYSYNRLSANLQMPSLIGSDAALCAPPTLLQLPLFPYFDGSNAVQILDGPNLCLDVCSLVIEAWKMIASLCSRRNCQSLKNTHICTVAVYT